MHTFFCFILYIGKENKKRRNIVLLLPIKKNHDFKTTAQRVSYVTIVANTSLAIFKLFAGIFARSHAMICDAIYSASDVLTTFILIIGISLSTKKSDKEHPYGHERRVCVVAIILAMMFFITDLLIAIEIS